MRRLLLVAMLAGCKQSGPEVAIAPIVPTASPVPCPDVSAFVQALPPGPPPPTFLDIAAGFDQTCGITKDHQIVCWGTTWSTARYLPEELAWKALPITLPADFVPAALDAGDSGGCARGSDGTVACWGSPRPDRSGMEFRQAARVRNVRSVTSLAVGHRGACATTVQGDVWCWGEGWHHDLGGDQSSDPPPDAIRIPNLRKAVQVVVEQQRACARLASGEVACWGNGNLPEMLPGVGDAVAIDIEGERACAAHTKGDVVCWDKVAQTPDSRLMHVTPHGETINVPSRVTPTPVAVPGITGAVDLAMGSESCARDAAGAVTCWETRSSSGTWTRAITHPAPTILARRLSGGTHHQCVLDGTGVGWCWGDDAARELGARVRLRSDTPVEICGVGDVVEVGAGDAFTCVRQRSGAVSCAGTNREQTVERSYLGTTAALRPTYVTDATMLSVGPHHACAVRPKGNAHCWGQAELPLGLTSTKFYPGNRSFPVAGIATIAAGTWRDCARLADGGVSCWPTVGSSAFAWESLPPPVRAPSLTDVKLLVGSCALEKSGRVVCWGDDFVQTQIPGATVVDQLQWLHGHPPEANPRTMWTDARTIAAGDGAVCAVVRDSVRCEGKTPLSVPASLGSGATSVTGLAVGGGRACVIDRAGIGCWDLAQKTPPLERIAISDAISISLGRTHACAVRRGGTVACWGADERGQLGAGPTPRATTAVRVDVLQ